MGELEAERQRLRSPMTNISLGAPTAPRMRQPLTVAKTPACLGYGSRDRSKAGNEVRINRAYSGQSGSSSVTICHALSL